MAVHAAEPRLSCTAAVTCIFLTVQTPQTRGSPLGVSPMPTRSSADRRPFTPTRSTRSASAGAALAALSHLTDRDRDLLAALEEHRVLRTDQVQRLFFPSLRRCHQR